MVSKDLRSEKQWADLWLPTIVSDVRSEEQKDPTSNEQIEKTSRDRQSEADTEGLPLTIFSQKLGPKHKRTHVCPPLRIVPQISMLLSSCVSYPAVLPPPLFFSFSLSLSLYLCLSVCLSVSLSVCLSMHLSPSLLPSLLLSLLRSLSISLSLSLFLSLSLSLLLPLAVFLSGLAESCQNLTVSVSLLHRGQQWHCLPCLYGPMAFLEASRLPNKASAVSAEAAPELTVSAAGGGRWRRQWQQHWQLWKQQR